jgi:hypothetical protein
MRPTLRTVSSIRAGTSSVNNELSNHLKMITSNHIKHDDDDDDDDDNNNENNNLDDDNDSSTPYKPSEVLSSNDGIKNETNTDNDIVIDTPFFNTTPHSSIDTGPLRSPVEANIDTSATENSIIHEPQPPLVVINPSSFSSPNRYNFQLIIIYINIFSS